MKSKLQDDELLKWDGLGLIPGPDEKEEDFQRRVEYCLKAKEHLFPEGEAVPSEAVEGGFAVVSRQFDFVPSWIPIVYSNFRLAPWHGGCAWIVQMEEGSPTTAFFQLRTRLKSGKPLLKLYTRDELVAHECVHVGRMMFEEPKYEEILAYSTSPNHWRRYWGPLVQTGGETICFMIVLLAILLLDIAFFFWGSGAALSQLMWLKAIPLLMAGLAVIRLVARQRIFRRCVNLVGFPVTCRLTDLEIERFSKLSLEEIRFYFERREGENLRCRLIKKKFFSS